MTERKHEPPASPDKPWNRKYPRSWWDNRYSYNRPSQQAKMNAIKLLVRATQERVNDL